MNTAASIIDSSILTEQARRELHDFYRFLVGKYVKRPARPGVQVTTPPGTAGALAASPIVGRGKDRDLGNSSEFARSLHEKPQK